MGAGLVAFTDARLRSGIELVMDLVRLPERLVGADLVITGEGRTDGQTLSGKVCAGVARAARAARVPCVVVSGSVVDRERVVRELGLAGAFSICPGPLDLSQAIARAPELLAATAGSVTRLFLAGRRQPAL
jgi:glycerate 2-kinase